MYKYDSEIENILNDKFKNALRDTHLIIKSQDRWKTPSIRREFDIVIYKSSNPLVIIEVKRTLKRNDLYEQAVEQTLSALSITNARFGIVTDGEAFHLYDRNQKDHKFLVSNFDEIIAKISTPSEINITTETKRHVLDIIHDAANQYLPDNQEFITFMSKRSLLSKIKFDPSSCTFYFSDEKSGVSSFENQFFMKMFGEFKDKKICRYSSLSTIFDMLKHNSFRMNGLLGMNDKSEINYVDSYLNGIQKPIDKEHHQTIMALNKRYITSCTNFSKKDDLTLWRLYSDDAKGVCLVFDIKKHNLNNHILLQQVKYADEKGQHKELEFLKQIKEEVESKTSFKFEFRKINYWKHFFKPYDYAVEDEVRLLVIDNDSLEKMQSDWVMTYTHSILNPIMDFRLNSSTFPIQLREIVLGPKCPEQETNYVQLQEMIRRKKQQVDKKISDLDKLKVSLSGITHYR